MWGILDDEISCECACILFGLPEIPGGTPDTITETVTENSRSLKFTSHEFESE